MFETTIDGKTLKGPDHYLNGALPAVPGDVKFEIRRSRGFEPMAKSPDGKKLYPMLEGPAWDADAKAFETKDGKAVTRIMEFDIATKAYTGKQWRYAFEEAANVIGDFQLLDATTGLVIERDDASEGARSQACAAEPKLDCFNKPAAFKRIYKIDLSGTDGMVRKLAYIDLTDIANPNKAARQGGNGERFVMPHLGPEGIGLVDATHIVVVNDNNLPYSSGRTIGKADDNELALLDIKALIDAK